MSQDWSRRQLLKNAGSAAVGVAGLSAVGAGIAGCGIAGSARTIAESTVSKGLRSFISRPDLSPPHIEVTTNGAPSSPSNILVATVASGPGQGGTMILRHDGQLIWFNPDVDASQMNLDLQTYQGREFLTWWQGHINGAGYGQGMGLIVDDSYQTIHEVHCVKGLQADLHEFNITPEGTALMTAYRLLKADLTPVGGPSDGYMVSGVAQEIDIATGKLVFEWDSLDHVPIEDTYQPFDYKNRTYGTIRQPFNAFHINSIALAPDGNLLICSRNTWTVYKVNRKTGDIMWRMNGKHSDFTMGPGAHFSWQHHARSHGDGSTFTVFDNGAFPQTEPQSRALILDVDEKKMEVSLRRAYTHPGVVLNSGAMGSVQLMDDGRVMVGWGTSPYFTEFSEDGKVLLEGKITKGDPTYRAFLTDFTGRPDQQPAVAARPRGGGATVYASWNGSTEVTRWTVFAGKSPTAMAKAGSVPKADFETAISVGSRGPYFAVMAHNASGAIIGRSNPVYIGTSPTIKQHNYGGCGTQGQCGY